MDALNIAEHAPGRERVARPAACVRRPTSMVLGAAHCWPSARFDGTVRFIFQPAEEHAAAQSDDGRRAVRALSGRRDLRHCTCRGCARHVLDACGRHHGEQDNFVIRIDGRTHARARMGIDPIVIGAQVVLALQTIVSRNLDPGQQAVISCTEFITDGLRNVLPSTVTIKGDTRSYSRDVQALLATRMREISEGICRTHGATCAFEYTTSSRRR